MTGLFRHLRDAVWRRKAARPPGTRQLFIDDHVIGGIEVLPASMADWCARQIGAIIAFSARHEAPDGAGWTDMYVRPPAPLSVTDLAIAFAPALEAIGRHLAPFDEIVTGSLTAPQTIGRARAFGPSALTAIILYGDKAARQVEQIELTLRGSAANVSQVLTALAALPSPQPLMVVDWQRGRYARPDDPHEVEWLLQQRSIRDGRS